MSYKIFWMNFHAGDTLMKIDNSDYYHNNRTYYKLFTETKSSRYVSFFYPVKDQIISLVDKETFFPYKYDKDLNEGNYREKDIIIFDHINETALSDNKNHKIPKGVHDPFSAIYFFRSLTLEVGKDVYFNMFDGSKVIKLVIKILKKEKISVPAGVFNTIKIEPVVSGTKGLFKHKGNLYVWVTDDEKKIPVLIESGVLIGAVSVKLVEYK
ncbi:MAG: DUF3108 domain-containing protein [Candidatus Firestonebacteria bacterium]|nr:DUF3108 domain-containing protein [Candidatus Firestonebacteria bacterium]